MFFNILSFYFYAYTDCCLQFEKVGSPAADEAMEKQADIERTEIERASHTQHAETVQGESSTGATLGDIPLLDRSIYYWAPAVQTPFEQHLSFDVTQPPIFSPPDTSHVSLFH